MSPLWTLLLVRAVSLIDLHVTEGLLCNYLIKSQFLDDKSVCKPELKPAKTAWD